MERSSKLEPIKIRSTVDQVEENIRKYIAAENFKPGDSLPTEQEFAASLGVSRNVVREALSRFRMLGMISSNKRDGLRLQKLDLAPTLERLLDPGAMDYTTLRELIEVRIMLEVGMGNALFRNMTAEHIQNLRKIMKDYESSKNPASKIEYEINFHSYLYDITGNSTLMSFQKYLKVVFDYVLKIEREKGKDNIPLPKVSHKQLVDCLENGSVEDFRQLMQDHFSTYSILL